MLLLNENKIDEMILILQHMQKYVPTVEREEKISIPSLEKVVLKSNTVQHPILFGGDQLTVARTRGAQIAMSNSNDSVKRLQGLIPVIQDWHMEVILTEVYNDHNNYLYHFINSV